MLLTSSVQNNLSRSHENSPTKPDTINTPALLYLAVISRDLCEKNVQANTLFHLMLKKAASHCDVYLSLNFPWFICTRKVPVHCKAPHLRASFADNCESRSSSVRML